MSQHLDSSGVAFLGQHRDNLFRRLVAEQLPQCLLVIGNTVLLYQRNEIPLRVTTECRFTKMRIEAEEICWPGVDVGEVAAAATGHQDFLADLIGAFQKHNVATTLRCNGGAHKSCGTSTNNNYVGMLHAGRITAGATLLRGDSNLDVRRRFITAAAFLFILLDYALCRAGAADSRLSV